MAPGSAGGCPADRAVVTRTLCLLGFGNVGRRFCELVARKGDELARDQGLRVRFAAVGTGSHGSLLAPHGLTAEEVLAQADGGAAPAADLDVADFRQVRRQAGGRSWSFGEPARPGVELIEASGADTLIEATPLDPHGGRLAIAHVEEALAHGLDVITVNKGPIAWDYRRLADLAAARGRRLRFEGTVMDGCPVFDLYWSCLPGCRVLGFDAVFNSTTNYILDAMGEGESFAAALAQVQAAGYAETDPSHDVDGHDAAAKTAALANVVMDARITPDDVPRESIRDVTPERVEQARGAGRRLRVLCTAVTTDLIPRVGPDRADGAGGSPSPPRVRASVRLVELPPEHAFFSASGSTLALLLHTDLMGTVQVAERDALPDQTAYAIYADLLAIHAAR
jgi:homoserine dehydrogenase